MIQVPTQTLIVVWEKNSLKQCNTNQIPLSLKKQAALAVEDNPTSLNPVAHVLKFQVSNHPRCWVK